MAYHLALWIGQEASQLPADPWKKLNTILKLSPLDLIPSPATEPTSLEHGHVYAHTRCVLYRLCQPDQRRGVWGGLPGELSDRIRGGGLAQHGTGDRGVFLPVWATGRAQPRLRCHQWLPLWGGGSGWAKAVEYTNLPYEHSRVLCKLAQAGQTNITIWGLDSTYESTLHVL